MAKKPSQFGRPSLDHERDVPDYLRATPKSTRVLANADIPDFAWLGDEGTLDAKSLIAHLVAPHALLRMVLASVVAAHPIEKPSPEARLDAVMKMLVGDFPARGRKHQEWYAQPLQMMAAEYLAGFFGLSQLNEPRCSCAPCTQPGSRVWHLEPGTAREPEKDSSQEV